MDPREHPAYGGHDDEHEKPRAMGDLGPDFRTEGMLKNPKDWGENAEDIVRADYDRPIGSGDNWLLSIKPGKYYNGKK